jgi:hypothetical protein
MQFQISGENVKRIHQTGIYNDETVEADGCKDDGVTNGMTHGDVKYILNSYSHCN